jgi:hypothetical protein
MANKGSEYEKRQDGSATVFNVTPATPPKFLLICVFGAFFALMGLGGLTGGSPGAGILGLAVGGWLIWYGLKRDIRPKEHRVVSTFRVAPDSVESNGRVIKKEDIHRLLLRNGITDQELMETYTTSASAAAGMAYRAQVARLANGLTLEAGGRSTFLAGGMDETTAYGLLHEVSRILGFK